MLYFTYRLSILESLQNLNKNYGLRIIHLITFKENFDIHAEEELP